MKNTAYYWMTDAEKLRVIKYERKQRAKKRVLRFLIHTAEFFGVLAAFCLIPICYLILKFAL